MPKLFGTDGIRGIAGEYPLDPSTVFKLGQAVAELGPRRIVIGRDTRASGVWIEQVLKSGIEAVGGTATLAGVITTPGVSFLARDIPFDAGIVISASHNPYRDNGIKIFSRTGIKLSDEDEEKIEKLGEKLGTDTHFPFFRKMGVCPQFFSELTFFDREAVDRYTTFLHGIVGVRSLQPLKVVLDCASGAAFHIAPRIFTEAGAEVIALNCEPDGCNINRNCGSLSPEQMARTVVDKQASFGVAFDGDCDRSIFADEHGHILDGDYVLYILSRFFKAQAKMNSGCVVTTVMANMGLEVALRREGLQTLRTRVGDRYVLEEMLRGDHALGGEQSGHIIIREHSPAGDGILTALKIATLLLEEGRSLGQLGKGLQKFPQVLMNVSVREKPDFMYIPEISREIDAAEATLGNTGRVIVRYSGTEPLVRIMLEGEDEAIIRKHAERIAARFREQLG